MRTIRHPPDHGSGWSHQPSPPASRHRAYAWSAWLLYSALTTDDIFHRTVYTCTDYHRLRSILRSTHSKEEWDSHLSSQVLHACKHSQVPCDVWQHHTDPDGTVWRYPYSSHCHRAAIWCQDLWTDIGRREQYCANNGCCGRYPAVCTQGLITLGFLDNIFLGTGWDPDDPDKLRQYYKGEICPPKFNSYRRLYTHPEIEKALEIHRSYS